MLLPNMSLADIKKAVLDDYYTELKAKTNMLKVSYKHKWIQNKRQDLTETLTYTTKKSKNTWRIVVRCNDLVVDTTSYLCTYNDFGITASHLITRGDPFVFLHFNTHFWQRYRERMQLDDIAKAEQLVKHFFRKNTYFMPCYYPLGNGEQQLFTPLDGGVGLGRYHEDDDIFDFKTFVDNSLLGDNQKKQIGEIYLETLTKIHDSLKEDLGIVDPDEDEDSDSPDK